MKSGLSISEMARVIAQQVPVSAVEVPSWATDFWKRFSYDYPASMQSIHYSVGMLGRELAYSILNHVCHQSAELAAKLKELRRAD